MANQGVGFIYKSLAKVEDGDFGSCAEEGFSDPAEPSVYVELLLAYLVQAGIV